VEGHKIVKICLLVPTPVPFVMGGAEKLFLGIVDALNHYTPHAAELIKIPLPEHPALDKLYKILSISCPSRADLDALFVDIRSKSHCKRLRYKY